jgi:hypothetical protein
MNKRKNMSKHRTIAVRQIKQAVGQLVKNEYLQNLSEKIGGAMPPHQQRYKRAETAT